MPPMSPAQRALYVEANETRNYDSIRKIGFRCDQPECRGVLEVERGLLNDPDALIECPECYILFDGAYIWHNLKPR